VSEQKKSGPEIVGGCIGVAGAPFLEAWVLMLVMGGIHDGVSERVPAVGYWPAVCLVISLNMLTAFVRKLRN
jgi:hypothetical protein